MPKLNFFSNTPSVMFWATYQENKLYDKCQTQAKLCQQMFWPWHENRLK